jgi:very-short-patch-repair endonuclease
VNAAQRALRGVLEEKGLPVGTTLENKVTWRLHRWGVLDKCQYRAGPYRLDYAWPAELIALEVDGPHHWRPDVAVKDVIRDAWLRAHGWLVFRVDDTGSDDALDTQLCRVVRMVRSEHDDWSALLTAGAAGGDAAS